MVDRLRWLTEICGDLLETAADNPGTGDIANILETANFLHTCQPCHPDSATHQVTAARLYTLLPTNLEWKTNIGMVPMPSNLIVHVFENWCIREQRSVFTLDYCLDHTLISQKKEKIVYQSRGKVFSALHRSLNRLVHIIQWLLYISGILTTLSEKHPES